MIVKMNDIYKSWEYWFAHITEGELLVDPNNDMYIATDVGKLVRLKDGVLIEPEENDLFINVTHQYQIVPITAKDF